MNSKSQVATISSLDAQETREAPNRSAPAGVDFFQIVENLPVPIYSTDAAGRITFYDEAAASLWGRRPKLGEEWWRGFWRLYRRDGTPIAHRVPAPNTAKHSSSHMEGARRTPITSPPDCEGFGSTLTRATVAGQLGGEISRDWRPEGVVIRLSLPRERLTG